MNAPPHPAKWSKELRPHLKRMLVGRERILDPLAGVGASEIRGMFHNELEPEWAIQCPQPVTLADARRLPYPDSCFDAICTSPVYGNRASDHFDAKDNSRRHTYRHYLGRPLHPANTGQLQWGTEYRKMHKAIWREAVRVLRVDGLFVLNISDHIRNGQLQRVSSWHVHMLESLGLMVTGMIPVTTRRLRHGENAGLRAPCEYLFVLVKGGNPETMDLFTTQPVSEMVNVPVGSAL